MTENGQVVMSAISSLSSSAFFTPILSNLQNSSVEVGKSTARLSSGNRIVNVGDDVASYSVAAGLQAQLSGLRQASNNVAQGTSLLQVASGGLTQIHDLLSQLNTLAVQASSGSLTDTDRGFLQESFRQVIASIDTIASSTSFNNIKLLDGSLAGDNTILTQPTVATHATGSITITGTPLATQTFKINGGTVAATTDFVIGGDTNTTATNLAAALNASTNAGISQATYEAVGSTILITAKAAGTAGNNIIIDKAGSTATAAFSVSGGSTIAANVYTLTGGLNDGVHANSTKATGSISDTLVTAQSQVSASSVLTFAAQPTNTETFKVGDGNGGLVTFTYVSGTPATSKEIKIGTSVEETLQNTVAKFTQYSGTDDYGVRQLDVRIQGNTLVFTNKNTGNVTDLSATAVAITEQLADGSLSAASFNNGTNTGVNVNGVSNSAFTGQISGFSATYIGADSITASITVGNSVYSAAISDTTPGVDTSVRFSSDEGGYFDVKLAGTLGLTVSDQPTADIYAQHLDAAFSGLTFTQERNLTNFTPTSTLLGSTATLQIDDFSDVHIDSVSVTAPVTDGSDATIDLSINGETFRASSGIGGGIGAYETVKFTNTTDSSQFITFTNGATAQDFSDEDAAATFESLLATAFDIGAGGSGTDFQVGPANSDKINVSVGSASSYTLFGGVTPDVSTQENAEAAQDVIETALTRTQTLISQVGGLESSFASSAANLQQSITGISAAHSALADTDIAAESTNFAQQILRVNAAVAVLAQANSLPSSLLSVLRSAGNA